MACHTAPAHKKKSRNDKNEQIVDVPASEIFEEILEVLPVLVQAVHAAPARVIEHVVLLTLHEYDASMMQILESFHHSVKQIADVPALASMDHHSASASSALREAQRSPGRTCCR